MNIKEGLRVMFGRKAKAAKGGGKREESLADHFKKRNEGGRLIDLLREPLDRAKMMRNVFQHGIDEIKLTVCRVSEGRSSFSTGGSVWAFDSATQTPVLRKEVDKDSVSAIEQYKAFSNTTPDIPDEIFAFYSRGFITWATCAQ